MLDMHTKLADVDDSPKWLKRHQNALLAISKQLNNQKIIVIKSYMDSGRQ